MKIEPACINDWLKNKLQYKTDSVIPYMWNIELKEQ